MALFKVSKGTSQNLPSTLIEGYCWYTYDDSKFYIDFKDENGTLIRKAINAKDAETLTGMSLEEIKEYVKEDVQDFVISATGMDDEGRIILDKTFAEMWEAYNKGKNLYLKGTLDGVEYSTIMLSSISPQRAIFAVAVEYTCIVFVVTSENGNLATPIMDEYVMRGELRDNYYTYEDVNAIFYKKEQVDDKLSAKADKSTTLSDYGITDAYTKDQVDEKIDNIGSGLPDSSGISTESTLTLTPEFDEYSVSWPNYEGSNNSSMSFYGNSTLPDVMVAGSIIKIQNNSYTVLEDINVRGSGNDKMYNLSLTQTSPNIPSNIWDDFGKLYIPKNITIEWKEKDTYTRVEVDTAIQAAIADIKTYINETLLGGEW